MTEPYDRAARRAADNAHGNQPTGGYTDVDDIARAVYPDPKVAHLKGESPTLVAARALVADPSDASPEPVKTKPKAKT